MSDREKTSHPWERYYAAQGRERVEQMRVTKAGQALPPAPLPHPKPPAPARPAPSAAAPGVQSSPEVPPPPAAAAPAKIDWNEVPLVELIDATTQQRAEVEAEAKRVHDALALLRVLSFGAGLVLVLVLAFEFLQFLTNDRPAEKSLQREAARVGEAMLAHYAAPGQPIAVQSVEAEFVDAPGKGRANYHLLVTLELLAPLYAPADSNGAQAYLQLQRATADAQQRVLASAALRTRAALLSPPSLPPLIAQTHRRGERLTIRVPLEAQRHGLRWELTTRPERRRALSPRFNGETMDRQPQPNLVFGAPASRDEMRRLQAEARDFILAVNRAALSD